MSVITSSSTSAVSTQQPSGSLVFFASDGTAGVLYTDGTNVELAYAAPPYSSWTVVAFISGTSYMVTGALKNASSDNVDVVGGGAASGRPTYKLLTKSGSTWTVGSGAQISTTAIGSTGANAGNVMVFCGQDPQGRYWIVVGGTSPFTASVAYTATTPTSAASWVQNISTTQTGDQWMPCGDIVGNYLLKTYWNGTAIQYHRLDVSAATLGVWSTGITIPNLGGSPDVSSRMQFLAVSSTKAVLAYSTTSGIYAQTYNPTTDTFSAAVQLSSNGNDRHPCVATDGAGVAWVFWCAFAAADNYALVVKKYDGTSWDGSATTLVASGTAIANLSAGYGANTVGVLYMVGTASPYTVSWTSFVTSSRTLLLTASLLTSSTRTLGANTVPLIATSTRTLATVTTPLIATRTRTSGATAPLIASSTRTLGTTVVLLVSSTRTLGTNTVALSGTSVRSLGNVTVPLITSSTRTLGANTVALSGTSVRSLAPTVALLTDNVRLMGANAALLGVSARSLASTVALLAPSERELLAEVILIVLDQPRTLGADASLFAPDQPRLIGTAVALLTEGTRAMGVTGAVLATPLRTVGATGALLAERVRTVGATGALLAEAARTVGADASLAGGARTLAASASMLAQGNRAVGASGAVQATAARSVSATAALLAQALMRSIPSQATLWLSGQERPIGTAVALRAEGARAMPATVAIAAPISRAMPATVALWAEGARAMPATLALWAEGARAIPVLACLREVNRQRTLGASVAVQQPARQRTIPLMVATSAATLSILITSGQMESRVPGGNVTVMISSGVMAVQPETFAGGSGASGTAITLLDVSVSLV